MKKKVLFTMLLSATFLVGCNGYSEVSAEKTKEIQTANLQKEVTYTKMITTSVVSKLNVDVKGDVASEFKDLTITTFKGIMLKAFGVEEVGKKVEKEVTDTTQINANRMSAELFVEQEGTKYYTSGDKIKVVSSATQEGLDVKQTIFINEYGYSTSVEIFEKGDVTSDTYTFSIDLAVKVTYSYSK